MIIIVLIMLKYLKHKGGVLIQSGILQHTQISLACFREDVVLQS